MSSFNSVILYIISTLFNQNDHSVKHILCFPNFFLQVELSFFVIYVIKTCLFSKIQISCYPYWIKSCPIIFLYENDHSSEFTSVLPTYLPNKIILIRCSLSAATVKNPASLSVIKNGGNYCSQNLGSSRNSNGFRLNYIRGLKLYRQGVLSLT